MEEKIINKGQNKGTLMTGLMLGTISFIVFGISLIIYVSGAFLIPALTGVLIILVVATEILSVGAFYLMIFYTLKNDTSQSEHKKGIIIGFILTGSAFFANTIAFLPMLMTGRMM